MTVEEYVMFHDRWAGAVLCAEMRGWSVRAHPAIEHFLPQPTTATATNTSGFVLHGSWHVKEDAKIDVYYSSAHGFHSHTFYKTQDGLQKLLNLLATTGTT